MFGTYCDAVRPFFLAALRDRRASGALSCFLRVYGHSLFGRPSGGRNLFILRFYRHSLSGRPSGGPIFRCTTKDRGERRAKGLRPLESPGVNSDRKPDVLCACVFAMVRVTRLSRLRRSAYPLASACCGCPVRTKDLRNHPTSDHKSGWLFNKCYEFAALRAVRMSPWKQCEARPKRGPRQDPAERSCWGEEEQRNERAGGEQPPQVIWSLRRRGLNRVNCITANS